MKYLKFDRVPQTVPGTRENTIDKTIPELRKSSFDTLSQRANQRALVASISSGDQEQVCLFDQKVLQILAAIAPVSQAQAAISAQAKAGATSRSSVLAGVNSTPTTNPI